MPELHDDNTADIQACLMSSQTFKSENLDVMHPDRTARPWSAHATAPAPKARFLCLPTPIVITYCWDKLQMCGAGRAFRSLACLALAQMAICPAPAVMNSSDGSVQVAAANRIQPQISKV